MIKHPTRLISHGDMSAEVDVDIADLILDLWKLDITTINSCQDNVPSGWVWVEFFSSGDAEMFLSLVSKYENRPGTMYNRIREADDDQFNWKYKVHPTDFGVNEFFIDENTVDEEFIGPHEFCFSFSIRFPQRDLTKVKNRIHNTVKKLNKIRNHHVDK